ncbi:type VII secretion-associated protein [Actinophytocola sediminis]
MTLRVAVDFGTSSTCVAASVRGREAQVVAVDGHPLMSSSVYAAADGTLFVGQEADRQAAVDPSRYEPHPKRRIDETELLLGASVVLVRDVIRAVLARAVAEARRVAGGLAVDQLVLTHPADWGGIRTQTLRRAAVGLAGRIVLVPEPVAAAVFHAASFPSGRRPGPPPALAVLDLGGGTMDVSVVRSLRAGSPGFQVLATHGDPTFGGADVDQLLLDHVGSVVASTDEAAWRGLIEGRELPDRRRRRVIHQDVRGAKETLSRHTYTDIPMPPPFADAHITRDDLERLITKHIDRAAELTVATIREAGLTPAGLTGIFLVGGSSRIPLVSRLVHQRTGVVPTSLDQPETVVARGALRAVVGGVEGTGPLAGEDLTVPDQRGPRRPGPPVPRLPVPRTPTQTGGLPVLPPPPIFPPPPVRRNNNRLLLFGAGGAVAVVLAVVLVVALGGGDTGTEGGPASSTPARPSRVIAQYEYQFALPEGWLQTGSDQQRLRTELKPTGREAGDDRLLVEEVRLSFDSTADRPRAVSQLRAKFEQAGETYADFDDRASFAGREVISYRERLPEATVDWYVVFDGQTQVNIGCQYADDSAARSAVSTACETVVATLTVTG